MHETGLFSNPFDSIRSEDETGEWWSARALMPIMGYTKWENFEEAIVRARAAARNSGFDPDRHASWHQETVSIRANAGQQSRVNYRLTRYGAYLVAMNGDPRKSEIAEAQTYFTIKTREAEVNSLLEPTDPLMALEIATQRTMKAIAIARQERDRADRAEHVLGIAAPKADAWQALAEATGDYSVREAAHILNRDPKIETGQRRLFANLREWKVIDRKDIPYQAHDRHVVLRARSFTDGLGVKRVEDQVRITVEGLRYLHKKLGGTMTFVALLESWKGGEQPAIPRQAAPEALFELESAR